MIAVDGDLMRETLYGALIAGTLLMRFAVIDRPRVWRAVGLGALIGFAALTRSEALLFVPFLIVPVAYRARPNWQGRGVIGVAAIIGLRRGAPPWTIRNESVFGRFVLVSTNNATVLAGANCNSHLPRGQHGGLGHHLRSAPDDDERGRAGGDLAA